MCSSCEMSTSSRRAYELNRSSTWKRTCPTSIPTPTVPNTERGNAVVPRESKFSRREPSRETKPQGVALHLTLRKPRRVRQTIPEQEHPLGGRLAVGRERVPCCRLVERHSHEPRAPIAVRLVAVLGLQQATPRQEMGVHVPEIERAAVGRVVVHGGEGRRGAQQVVFHEADHPRDVPAG